MITAIISILLTAIAYTDFKDRAVPVFLLLALLLTSFLNTFLQVDITTALWQLFTNTALVLLLLGSLLIYYRLKQGSFKQVVNQKLGLGDIVFWLAITPLFSLVNFILFFVSSLLAVLLIMIVRIASGRPVTLVPLAGYQALVLMVIMIINALFFNHPFSIDLLSFYPNP